MFSFSSSPHSVLTAQSGVVRQPERINLSVYCVVFTILIVLCCDIVVISECELVFVCHGFSDKLVSPNSLTLN